MIIFQQVVAGDQKYTVANQANLTVFDVHNDSPYNMGVSLGHDTGLGNADYYTSPHSILTGIGPKGNAPNVGNVKWVGTIYVYTQTPLGGGVTNLASVPASQITAIGYPTGYQPMGTTSLSRWNNVGNVISTVGGVANSVQNDGNPVGTSVVEATPTGAGSSSVSLLNQGVLQLGQNVSAESGEITLLDAAGTAFNAVYQGGKATIPGGITANLMTAQSSNDIGLHVASGQHVIDTINGINTFSVGSSGPNLLAGTLQFLAGTISRIVISGPFTVQIAGTSCAHGLGVVPTMVIPISDQSAGNAGFYGVALGSASSSNVTVSSNIANSRTWLVSIAI